LENMWRQGSLGLQRGPGTPGVPGSHLAGQRSIPQRAGRGLVLLFFLRRNSQLSCTLGAFGVPWDLSGRCLQGQRSRGVSSAVARVSKSQSDNLGSRMLSGLLCRPLGTTEFFTGNFRPSCRGLCRRDSIGGPEGTDISRVRILPTEPRDYQRHGLSKDCARFHFGG
jgi:hypothetical protein